MAERYLDFTYLYYTMDPVLGPRNSYTSIRWCYVLYGSPGARTPAAPRSRRSSNGSSSPWNREAPWRQNANSMYRAHMRLSLSIDLIPEDPELQIELSCPAER